MESAKMIFAVARSCKDFAIASGLIGAMLMLLFGMCFKKFREWLE